MSVWFFAANGIWHGDFFGRSIEYGVRRYNEVKHCHVQCTMMHVFLAIMISGGGSSSAFVMPLPLTNSSHGVTHFGLCVCTASKICASSRIRQKIFLIWWGSTAPATATLTSYHHLSAYPDLPVDYIDEHSISSNSAIERCCMVRF